MSNSLNLRSARRRLKQAQKGGYSRPVASPNNSNITITSFQALEYSRYNRDLDKHIAVNGAGEEIAFDALIDGKTGAIEIGSKILYSQGFGTWSPS